MMQMLAMVKMVSSLLFYELQVLRFCYYGFSLLRFYGLLLRFDADANHCQKQGFF